MKQHIEFAGPEPAQPTTLEAALEQIAELEAELKPLRWFRERTAIHTGVSLSEFDRNLAEAMRRSAM